MTETIDLAARNAELLRRRREEVKKEPEHAVQKAITKLGGGFKLDPAEAAKRKQSELDEQERVRKTQMDTIRKHWNAPERHASRAELVSVPAWDQTLAMLKGKLGTGFIIALVGTRGPGKTQLAVELMKHACQGLIFSRYAHTLEIFIDIKSTYRREAARTERGVIDEYCSRPLLVIDECQERGETEWESRILRYIVDKRYQDKKDTLLISNGDADSLKANLGDSIVSRCNETGGFKVCDWKSFRT